MNKNSASVILKGGLGNQMFQFAFAETLANKRSADIFLDSRYLNSRSWRPNFTYRQFDLDIFDHNFNLLEKCRYLPGEFYIQLMKWFIIKQLAVKFGWNSSQTGVEDSFYYDRKLVDRNCREYFGYFQSFRYFKAVEDKIKRAFVVKKQDLLLNSIPYFKIENCNSVCVNVRRTDFVDSILGVPDIKFYMTAVEIMKNKTLNPRFFIFSDDVEWCRQHLGFISNAMIIDHTHAGRKFANYWNLMRSCNHFIIPNSSFAWWAAYLADAENKQVIVPKGWHKYLGLNGDRDIVPEDWYRVEANWTA